MDSMISSTVLLALGGLSTAAGGLAILSLASGDGESTLVFGGVLLAIAAVSVAVGEPGQSTT